MIKDLDEKIIEWAKLRDLDKKGTMYGQRVKTIEEFAELLKGISKGDFDLVKDSIGDVYVTIIIANMLKKSEKIDLKKAMKDAKVDYKDVYSLHFGNQNYAINQMQKATSCMRELLFIGYTQHTVTMCLMYLMAMAEIYKSSLKECVELAYQEIKNRRGKIIDGTFVKESDLNG